MMNPECCGCQNRDDCWLWLVLSGDSCPDWENETELLGESCQPDRKIEGVWFKTAAGEIIEPGHFVEYLRKKMEEDGS